MRTGPQRTEYDVPELGLLTDLKVFVYYDGPLYFAGKKDDTWYIVSAGFDMIDTDTDEEDEDGFWPNTWESTYYYANVSEDMLAKLESGEINSHQVFKEAKDGEVNKVFVRSEQIKCSDLDVKDLPITYNGKAILD